MPITYEIDHQQRIIYESWSGDIHAADLERHWSVYLRDAQVLATRRTLVDLRSSTIHFTGQDLDRLVDTVAVPLVGNAGWKTAIVVDRPVQFGVSRQYQVFANAYSKDAIFRDPAEALTWLVKD